MVLCPMGTEVNGKGVEIQLFLSPATSLSESAFRFFLVGRIVASFKIFGTIYAFSLAERLEVLVMALACSVDSFVYVFA